MTVRSKLASTADLSFGNGCFFFLPYLAIYIAGWALRAPVDRLKPLFLLLHAANAGLLLLFVLRHRRRFRLADGCFFGGLFLLFAAVGAYLEYPSDAWEHFRRIYGWQASDRIAGSPLRGKFAYFWGYTLLSGVGPTDRRIFLDLYGAGFELLVGAQVYALARRLGFERSWARLHVLAFFACFGTYLFGFRYYALSSTPLAYAAYLRGLICWIDYCEGKSPSALTSTLLLAMLAAANHVQGVIFLVLSGGVVFALAWFGAAPASSRRRAARAAALLVLASLVGGALARPHLSGWLGAGGAQLAWFGGLRLWQRAYFLETYGIHGILALAATPFLLRRLPRVAWLTLAPSLVLLWPVFAIPFVYASGAAAYRILYAFPTSIALVEGMRVLSGAAARRLFGRSAPRGELVATGLALLALAAPPAFPWRGRLFFAVHRPSDERSLRFADAAAEWLLAHRGRGSACRLLSDPATSFALAAHLGCEPDVFRAYPIAVSREVASPRELLRALEDRDLCGVLVAATERLPKGPVPSPVAEASGHWDPRLADLRWLVGRRFAQSAEALLRVGWKKTPVPPFYALYEPRSGACAAPARG